MLLILLGDKIQRRNHQAALRRRSAAGQPRDRAARVHLRPTGRSASRRVLSDEHGARVRRARRPRLRQKDAPPGLRTRGRQEADRPPFQVRRRRVCQSRRSAEGRPAAARQIHPQRASADHRAGPLAPERLAGRRLCSSRCRRKCAPTSPCAWAISTRSRPRSSTKSPPSSARNCRPSANSAANPMAASAPWRKCSTGSIPAPARRSSKSSKSRIPTWSRPSATSCSSSRTCS